MTTEASFAGYLARWRGQEAEMEFAEPFVPRALRERFQAWGTLLGEIEASLFEPSSVEVAIRRLGWWSSELREAQPQHPIARALRGAGIEGDGAAAVAAAALSLAHIDDAPADSTAALAAFAPYAAAVDALERDAFASTTAADGRAAIAAGTLARWAPRAGTFPLLRERMPLHLLARHAALPAAASATASAIDLARELAPQALPTPALPLYRALRWDLDRARIEQLARGSVPDPGRPVPKPWRATWIAWNAARRAAT